MPADKPQVSRRTALAALATVFLAGCSRLLFYAANFPTLFGSYRRLADIPYGAAKHQRVDVYMPPGDGKNRPLVVFWHGGRWESGDKADYRFVGAALASLGYVAMLPNYRHYPEVKMPGFMEDTALAARWASAHAADYGALRERMYLMGHSSGAHMAALVTLNPAYFQALGGAPPIAGFIGLSGPFDFLPLKEADVQDMFGPPENYPASQPINFVREGEPPMLLIHGLNDDVVLPKNSRNLAAALEARGNKVTLRLYPKASHADTVAALSAPARSRAPTMSDIAAFIGGEKP